MELFIVLAIFVVLALIVGVTMIVLAAVVGVGVFAAAKANTQAKQAVKRVLATPIAQAAEGAERCTPKGRDNGGLRSRRAGPI